MHLLNPMVILQKHLLNLILVFHRKNIKSIFLKYLLNPIHVMSILHRHWIHLVSLQRHVLTKSNGSYWMHLLSLQRILLKSMILTECIGNLYRDSYYNQWFLLNLLNIQKHLIHWVVYNPLDLTIIILWRPLLNPSHPLHFWDGWQFLSFFITKIQNPFIWVFCIDAS